MHFGVYRINAATTTNIYSRINNVFPRIPESGGGGAVLMVEFFRSRFEKNGKVVGLVD